MTYTGNVKVGGPPDTREIDGLTITKLAVGPMDNNAYLLRDTATGEGLLIDAANEADRLIELIGGTPITWIVTTHRHYDHWQALAEVQQATGAVLVAHTEDAGELPVPSTMTSPTATSCGSATRPCPSSICAGTRPAASHSVMTPRARGRIAAPVHRGLAVPGRPGQDHEPKGLHLADG